jgi:hypothetical protein
MKNNYRSFIWGFVIGAFCFAFGLLFGMSGKRHFDSSVAASAPPCQQTVQGVVSTPDNSKVDAVIRNFQTLPKKEKGK